MQSLIQKFVKTTEQTLNILDSYPAVKRKVVLFDTWTLHDILAHLNGWLNHYIETLDMFKKDLEPKWVQSIDIYNTDNIEDRREHSWEQLRTEFISLSQDLVDLYTSLPEERLDMKFWPNRKYTPKGYLQLEIDHQEKEHWPSLEGNLMP